MFKKIVFIIAPAIFLVVALIWVVLVKFEGEEPAVSLDRDITYLGKQNQVTLILRDQKSGINKIMVKFSQKGKEIVLLEKLFPLQNWFGWPDVSEQKIELTIEPGKLGIQDGPASVICTAWDHSLREWFHGNRTIFQKDITIDTVQPIVSVISNTRYLEQGGVGLVCFSVSEKVDKAGVKVGNQMYPGSPLDASRNVYQTCFVVPPDYTNEKMQVWAQDMAGNSSAADFYYRVKARRFRNDTLELSDNFLKQVTERFSQIYPDLGNDPVNAFLRINTDIRKQSDQKIREICSTSSPEKLWDGVFLALPNGEARAHFADSRTYTYGGKEISSSVHLGVDLASLANSPVPAGNDGVVVWADFLGIYGNTVIIDHGFGLFSLYGHLSAIATAKGDQVKKGQTIGSTGFTGLAGGDHLHFGMYLWGTPVNPAEWWDPAWIQKKIMEPLSVVTKPSEPSSVPTTEAFPSAPPAGPEQPEQSEATNGR
jgi:murein DD-endopeptidase MepM/ murein hydrolase activator NlpD